MISDGVGLVEGRTLAAVVLGRPLKDGEKL